MLGQKKQSDKRGILLAVIAVAVIAAIVIFSPGSKALRLQTKAGNVISNYVAELEQTEGSQSGLFYCILPTIHPDAPKETQLDQAISWLNEAKSIAPRNAYSSFLLGQTYCLAGMYSEAIEELSAFVQKRETNPLGVAELGFAQLSLDLLNADTNQTDTELENARLLLEKAGFGAGYFEGTGEKAYKQGNYQGALTWFNIAEKLAPLSEANSKQHALLRVAFEGSDEFPFGLPVIDLGENTNELIIEPKQLFQLQNWQPVEVRRIDDNEAAVIWSNNSIIGALIDVAQPSEYCLTVSAVDQKPKPTLLAVYLNFKKMLVIELTEGDGKIKEFMLPVEMEMVPSLISIKLLNDYYSASEGDRNGYISAISITPCPTN